MTTLGVHCPTCSKPVPPPAPTTRVPRQFCSKPCASRANGAAVSARHATLDEMAVVRLLAGSPVTSTKAERIEAVRVLTGRGRAASWIAEFLHITERSVTRYRAELAARTVVRDRAQAA